MELSKLILFVDDDPKVRRIFQRIAVRLGYEVSLCSNGSDALAMVQDSHYPVIITDLCMPGLDGLALLECIRTLSPDSTTLLVTGAPELELPCVNTRDSSFAAILRKPLDLDETDKALSRAFDLYRDSNEPPDKLARDFLLVEDEPVEAQLTSARLRKAIPGAKVRIASRICEAEDFLQDKRVGVILTDLTLPDARGLDAVNRLRVAQPEAAIVVLSAARCENLAVSTLRNGAQDYILKDNANGDTLKRCIRYAQERKSQERELKQLAYHDSVTGLPNRQLFQDRLVQALARARREKSKPAVVFVDLNKFKEVNDSLGHEAGDQVLRCVARRMRVMLRESDTVARIGGDEFALITEGASTVEVSQLCRRLLEGITEPIQIDGESVSVGASFGGALYPEHGFTADGLLKSADAAMYRSKRSASGKLIWAGENLDLKSEERLKVGEDLTAAKERGELELFFQPQFDLVKDKVVGFEALLRWRKDGKVLSPARFLSTINELNMWENFGLWVLEESCKQAAGWPSEWTVSVNISSQQLHQGLLAQVDEALRSSGLDASRLILEITESSALGEERRALPLMKRLREFGVVLIMDNFGTGLSSLATLQKFPVQGLKLGRKLLQENESLLGAFVQMGHALGCTVGVTGVESARQCQACYDVGCDFVQGYLIAEPLASQDVERWHRDFSRKETRLRLVSKEGGQGESLTSMRTLQSGPV